MIVTVIKARELIDCNRDVTNSNEVLPGGGVHVTRLNFKTSCVGVYKCLLPIVGFAVTVAIWPREVVSCRDFILRAVPTFWAMSLVGIYPGRASVIALKHPQKRLQVICCEKSNFQLLSYLRRQLPTFCDAATGLPAKRRLRNEHRNSMLMMCHYPNLGSASGWSKFPTWHDQSEHSDQGSDTSLAWNFCACF